MISTPIEPEPPWNPGMGTSWLPGRYDSSGAVQLARTVRGPHAGRHGRRVERQIPHTWGVSARRRVDWAEKERPQLRLPDLCNGLAASTSRRSSRRWTRRAIRKPAQPRGATPVSRACQPDCRSLTRAGVVLEAPPPLGRSQRPLSQAAAPSSRASPDVEQAQLPLSMQGGRSCWAFGGTIPFVSG
jgi:hypothetical protein